MADTATQTGTTTTQIVADKNKSAEQYIKEAEVQYIIPRLVRETFPDLIKLIYETESMNAEEREYWMQILPIMTEEQIKKFRDILVNEKKQLEKLDREYEQGAGRFMGAPKPEFNEVKMKEVLQKVQSEEKTHEEEEKAAEEDLLKKLQGL